MRLVYARAILTAFSTASAPELNSADFLAWSPGVSSASCSQTSTYPSYGVTMKQVWVKSASCAEARRTTASAEAPTEVTAMPEPKSISRLPSTSSMIPPPARAVKTGSVEPTPAATAATRRACSSADFGPGMAVTTRRSCGMSDMRGSWGCFGRFCFCRLGAGAGSGHAPIGSDGGVSLSATDRWPRGGTGRLPAGPSGRMAELPVHGH